MQVAYVTHCTAKISRAHLIWYFVNIALQFLFTAVFGTATGVAGTSSCRRAAQNSGVKK
jgi:hypothetical protein